MLLYAQDFFVKKMACNVYQMIGTRMEFPNIMHNDCLAHDYYVYEIFSLLSIFIVKLRHFILCNI